MRRPCRVLALASLSMTLIVSACSTENAGGTAKLTGGARRSTANTDKVSQHAQRDDAKGADAPSTDIDTGTEHQLGHTVPASGSEAAPNSSDLSTSQATATNTPV